jgi:hypothetical protein
MDALTIWKRATADGSNFLERLVALLEAKNVAYCLIGGYGVNAYVEPLISLDLALAVAADFCLWGGLSTRQADCQSASSGAPRHASLRSSRRLTTAGADRRSALHGASPSLFGSTSQSRLSSH